MPRIGEKNSTATSVDRKVISKTQFTRWGKLLALVVLVPTVIFLGVNLDRLHIYWIYLTEASPHVQMRFSELSYGMDETAIRQHFQGVGLDCFNQSQQSNGLGDRVCYTSIDSADGQTALTLALFSSGGHLRHAMVQLPWWSHEKTLLEIVRRHGKANRDGWVGTVSGGPVLRWDLSNGHLTMNRNRQMLTLGWSALLWTAKEVER